MRRREFIMLIGGVAAGCPLATRAQQTATPVVGFLSSRSPSESSVLIDSFRKGLRQLGSVEGQNVNIAFRCADILRHVSTHIDARRFNQAYPISATSMSVWSSRQAYHVSSRQE